MFKLIFFPFIFLGFFGILISKNSSKRTENFSYYFNSDSSKSDNSLISSNSPNSINNDDLKRLRDKAKWEIYKNNKTFKGFYIDDFFNDTLFIRRGSILKSIYIKDIDRIFFNRKKEKIGGALLGAGFGAVFGLTIGILINHEKYYYTSGWFPKIKSESLVSSLIGLGLGALIGSIFAPDLISKNMSNQNIIDLNLQNKSIVEKRLIINKRIFNTE